MPENLSLKTDVFQQLDLLAPENAILASSSSTMGCSSFTKDMKRRNRCIVCHPVMISLLLHRGCVFEHSSYNAGLMF